MTDKNILIDFNHRQSAHCETGVTSNLLRHYGLDISEAMVLGIGSGLFFCYFPFIKIQDAPLITFRTTPNSIFKNTAHRLKTEFQVIKKFREPLTAMEALDRNLAEGIPTALQVGIYNLSYFSPEYRMHYNFHNIVIYGKEDGHYLVSEPVSENTQVLSYQDLVKVRFSKGAFRPNGKMYFLTKIPSEPDLREAVRRGIHMTVRKMLKDRFPLVGVRGIRKLGKDVKKWPEKYPEKGLIYQLMVLVRNIEEIGSGGAGFRFLYGAFLKEAGEKLNNSKLTDLSNEMGETANKWRELAYRGARYIKDRSESTDDFSDFSEILMECADREESIFSGLDRLHI